VIDVTKHKWFIDARSRQRKRLLREWLEAQLNACRNMEQDPARKAEGLPGVSGKTESKIERISRLMRLLYNAR
jgi:hypothetical protein